MTATAAEVTEFAERIGQPLTRWQRTLAEAVFSPGSPSLGRATVLRINERTLHRRTIAEFHALRGERVHSLHHDGEWCVTAHPVGYLYSRAATARGRVSDGG